MIILGLSSNYHDSSAALIVNGELVASSAEERFTLQKHDSSFPTFAIEFCLRKAGLTRKEIDYVVYHEQPTGKLSRTMSTSIVHFPFSFPTFFKSAKESITTGIWLRHEISSALDIEPEKIIFIPHHMSHAAYSFAASGLDEAAVVTVDAIGEWTASAIFHAKKINGQIEIVPVHIIPFPHSLGLFYSAVTAYLGFRVNDAECSTMALASFGKPTYLEQFRDVLRNNPEDNLYALNLDYFNFRSDNELPLSRKFIQTFGRPRSFKEALAFDSLKETQAITADQQRFADIAASAQIILEEKVQEIVVKAKEMTKSTNLCLSGGVALNCVSNGKIVEQKLFKNVFVPSDPGDGGGAAGAAVYGSILLDKKNPVKIAKTPYLGESYQADVAEEIIAGSALLREKIEIYKFEGKEDLCSFVADKIIDNKVVGWMQGSFESGPRALGNRSILFKPDIEIARFVSQKIKKRAGFRPYACSLTTDFAKEFFETELSENDLANSRWMQFSYRVKDKYLEQTRGALHVDHSTRPHLCSPEDNPVFYDLLKTYERKSSLPVLTNTSFNFSGLPLVSSPQEALLMFYQTELHLLVINNVVFVKK